MVVDVISNARLYFGMGDRLKMALEYIQRTDFQTVRPGTYSVDGDDVFVVVQEYESKNPELGKWESHRKYIDIQYVFEGVEQIGWAHIAGMEVSEPYDANTDCAWYRGQGSAVRLKAGAFAVLGPEDVHMPGLADGNPTQVKKIIVKVRVQDNIA